MMKLLVWPEGVGCSKSQIGYLLELEGGELRIKTLRITH